MKHLIFILAFVLSVPTSIGQTEDNDTLYRVVIETEEFPYTLSGYVNAIGDTVIPLGKYDHCFTEKFIHFAIVYADLLGFMKMVGIDREEKILFAVESFDNGPDWIEEGLFRVRKYGKIGYANKYGEIVIKPQFACADQFQDGKARVTLDCELIPEGEYTFMQSDTWFYIDLNGNRLPE